MHDANKHMQHFWSRREMMSDLQSLDRLIKAINQIKNGENSQFQESQKPTLRSPGRKDWVLVNLTFHTALFSTKMVSDEWKRARDRMENRKALMPQRIAFTKTRVVTDFRQLLSSVQ